MKTNTFVSLRLQFNCGVLSKVAGDHTVGVAVFL